ncbi:MAG: tyrosine-type recombinase/integrase [bacterium]
MSQRPFLSARAKDLNEFVAYKHSQGDEYDSGQRVLWYFDHFLLSNGYDRPELTHDILSRYVAAQRHLSKNTQYGRLAVTRVFARWLRRLVPGSAVIEDIAVKRPALPRHYLYSHDEIVAIIQTARQAKTGRNCPATLIGLLYATGLRISEALALNVGDINLVASRLTVRRGKFGKARNIMLSATTVAALGRFLDSRFEWGAMGRDAPVFLDAQGKRLKYERVSKAFRTILRLCKIGASAAQAPRLHDLRHTYACDCLRKWYAEGVDVNVRLPILATAMGHVHINNTQLYLHVTAQLLQVAADRFHKTFTNNCQGTHL